MILLVIISYMPIEPLIPIKIISIIFDFVCAISSMKIAKILLKNNKDKELISCLVYSVILFLPTVILNSSKWAQSDSIYTGFVIISLLYLIKKKYMRSFIYLGIAFSFKLQVIFILPLYIWIYISGKKFSVYCFGLIPLVNFISFLPAIIFGRPIIDCIRIYIGQIHENNNALTLNFPNIYSIFYNFENTFVVTNEPEKIYFFIFLVLVILIILTFVIWIKNINFDSKQIIEFGLLSVIICTFLLPRMHERYLYMADIISIIYLICNKDKLYVPISISLISLKGYMVFLSYQFNNLEYKYYGILFLIIFILIFKDITQKYFMSDTKEK